MGRPQDAWHIGLRLFAALLSTENKPIDASRRAASLELSGLTIVGKARRAAFLVGPGSTLDSLGSSLWIAGSIRLDARDELRARLGAAAATVSDAMLCLQAYAKWGEAFTDFLTGDFAFALWDDGRQWLLVGRDQLGVRTVFHSRTAEAWLVSDSLDWLAAQTSAVDALDDYWIADHLTLGMSREFERTVYRAISRVPPAHVLKLGEGSPALHRYWKLDIAEPLYLSRPEDYTERFRDLLSRAVADRLPAGKVGISMSGGVDSTTLAAATVGVTGDPAQVVAECEHYARLAHTREDYFASLAARHLGIDLRIRLVDDLAFDPQWRSRGIGSPEPTPALLSAHHSQLIGRERAALSDVWLNGEGPDNALTLERNAYLRWLFQRSSWQRLAAALLQYTATKGLAGWAQSMTRHIGRKQTASQALTDATPRWIRRDFAESLHLADRANALGLGGDESHPWHPAAIASFTSPIWQTFFDEHAFDASLGDIEWRYPYLDLRVLTFMLSVPPLPWGWKKRLIRASMQGRLPAEVLAREKTPLPAYPQAAMIRPVGLPELSKTSEVRRYVEPQFLAGTDAPNNDLESTLAVHAFDHWLELKHH